MAEQNRQRLNERAGTTQQHSCGAHLERRVDEEGLLARGAAGRRHVVNRCDDAVRVEVRGIPGRNTEKTTKNETRCNRKQQAWR